MAVRSKRNDFDTEEGKIPVLTVLKNGAILKNIFIVNKPPEEPFCINNLRSLASVRDHEDVLIVGRHPACNIMLTHPSISRFHLRLRSKPSSQKLSVVDLSSVHGTWVSERKLDPGVSVGLKEGDTLRIGCSSRVYRLHWIPISVAYDLENSLVSELDVALVEAMREEDAGPEDGKVEKIQDEKFCLVHDEEIQSMDSTLEFVDSLFPDENLDLTVKEGIRSSPPMTEEVICLTCDEEGKGPLEDDHRQRRTYGFMNAACETKTVNFPTTSVGENPPDLKSVSECSNAESSMKRPEKITGFSAKLESQSYLPENSGKAIILNSLKEHLTESICLPIADAVQGFNMQQFQNVIDVPPETFTSQLLPGKQGAFLEKHWSDLTNPDPAPFDEKSEAEMLMETESLCTVRYVDAVKDILAAEAGKLITEITSLPIEEAIPDNKFQQVEIVEEVTMYSLSDGKKQDEFCQQHESKLQALLNGKYCQEQGHSIDGIVQDINDTVGIYPISPPAASVNTSMPDEAILEIKNKKENPTSLSLSAVAGRPEIKILESYVEAREKNLTSCNKWSGRDSSAPQIQNSETRVAGIANADTEFQMINDKDIVKKSISQDFFSVSKGEEEVFTPDKENFSPNALQWQFLKKKVKLEEIKQLKSRRSDNLKANVSASIYPDESMSSSSSKEDQTSKVAQVQKLESRLICGHSKSGQETHIMALKNRVNWVPIQSLHMNAAGKSRSETSDQLSAAEKIIASNCGQILSSQGNTFHISGAQKRKWDMIVDTASLLNKESRKALQLLQGLKGTRLVIPSMVKRELDSMKQGFSIFKRTSEASLVLEWIEECMTKTKWWIHVLSSTDEEKLTAPTPPTPPEIHSCEESWTFPSGIGIPQPLSFHKSSTESVSSTDEDPILDCALLYRTKENSGQLVLLSDDVALKIKSMAKGLLCETVEEFRESLVNPFSERFLWANSYPRGLTWSFQDDVALRDAYCRLSLRKLSKGEGAMGLKLILLQSS